MAAGGEGLALARGQLGTGSFHEAGDHRAGEVGRAASDPAAYLLTAAYSFRCRNFLSSRTGNNLKAYVVISTELIQTSLE